MAHMFAKILDLFNLMPVKASSKLHNVSLILVHDLAVLTLKLLPDPTTMSRNLKTMASEIKIKLIPELKANLNEAVGTATLDMWTDDHRKIGHLCFTLHYFKKTWNLTLKKTGENI